MDLHQHWAAVRARLTAARTLLPANLREDPVQGSVERFYDWLENNELELALDELEGLGEINSAPTSFWEELRAAAEQMGLVEHAARYGQRLSA